MANKLYLDNKDYDAPYEPSASEDEYSEEEKEILKEIRQRNKRKPDSKKEVLAFDDNSDEADDNDDGDDDIIGDSDIERGDEDDGIPDSKAWGKQRRSYYNTDFVDQDYSTYNEKEEEQAQQEEEEAKSIQLRLAKQLDEADFFLDIPAGTASADEDEDESTNKQDEEKIKLKTDLSGLSEREKQQLFEKDSPEFAGLVSDFQTQLLESQNLLNPILEFATERKLNLPIFEFVETRNNLILTYCSNVAIYLLLKAKRISIKYHPITKRLAQLRKILIQLQEKYENVVRPQLEDLLEKIESGEDVEILVKPVEKKSSKKLRMMKGYTEDDVPSDDEDEDEADEQSLKHGNGIASSGDEDEEGEEGEEENEDGDVAERRGITYQIAKNKGLTAHRKKELRNPRVKHRSKFRKALIRRKGAVRTVRTETKRYGGEISGIKATVKKGIKIKS